MKFQQSFHLQCCQDLLHVQVQPHDGQCQGDNHGEHYCNDLFLLDVFLLYNQLYLQYSYSMMINKITNYLRATS